MRRLPRVFWLFVAVQVAQPGLFEFVGALSGPFNKKGAAFVGLLLVGLGYRSRIAWTLLLLMNAVSALAPLAGLGDDNVLWAHVVVMVGTSGALTALLVSRQMREHVWSCRHTVPAAP